MIYQKHPNVDQSVHNCSEKISYLFNFIRFSTCRYTYYKWVNWCSCAMLPWKVVLISLHQKWLGLAVMGKYHSILLMLFNLAFLMKCKYFVLKLKWGFLIIWCPSVYVSVSWTTGWNHSKFDKMISLVVRIEVLWR